MKEKIFRYTVDIGAGFDGTTVPNLFIDSASADSGATGTISTVSPGSTVTLRSATLKVPTGASKMIKWVWPNKEACLFVNSNNQLVTGSYAYLVRPVNNSVSITVNFQTELA